MAGQIESRTSLVVAVTMFCLGLSFIAVVLRFVSRGLILKKIGLDDWLMALAWIFSFGVTFSIYLGSTYGLGTDYIPEENSVRERKTRFVYTLLYQPALMAIKTSTLLFYLSISQNFRLVQWGNWATLLVVNVGGTILMFLVAFQCKPLSDTFVIHMSSTTKCIATYTLIYASAPQNIITDIAILVLPIPVLTSLRLPRKQKVILIGVFAGGGLTSIIGIIRIFFFKRALATESSNPGLDSDIHTYSWNGALSFMWSSVEINAGIVCASIPMVKPLVAKVFPICIGVSGDTIDSTLSSSEFITSELPKSAIALTVKESLKPISLVTVLFFLWGFAYGFVSTINQRFEGLLGISVEKSLGLHAAYFSGYLAGPLLFSGGLLKKYGFKATFIVGLCINGCGCLVFWPSAVLRSYIGFSISMVILGFGLATTEVAANLFMVLCGPQKYFEFRLSISQGFQAVGGLIGPVVASYVLPEFIAGETSLEGVQWVYLGIAFFVFLLAIAFYYSTIPEVKYVYKTVIIIADLDFSILIVYLPRDSDFPTGPERRGPISLWKGEYGIGFAWGIMAQFLCCGAQEVISRFSGVYLGEGTSTIYSYSNASHGLFIAGRFLAGFAMLTLRPRYILLTSLVGCTISTTFALITTDKNTGFGMIQLMWFFGSSIFPIVFATSIRGLGKHSNDAARYQVSASVGAAIFPALYYGVLKKSNPRYAMNVTLSAFAIAVTYPIYLCISPRERKRLDRTSCSGTVPDDTTGPITLQNIKADKGKYLEVT